MKPFACVALLVLVAGLVPMVARPMEHCQVDEGCDVNRQSHFEVTEKTILHLQAALEAGEVTSRELVKLYRQEPRPVGLRYCHNAADSQRSAVSQLRFAQKIGGEEAAAQVGTGKQLCDYGSFYFVEFRLDAVFI